nr:uncharacterized protein MAL13P1.304-like isoform X2 [Procambarus clarkii]
MSKKDVLEEAKRQAAEPGSYIKKVERELPLCIHPKFTQEMRKGVYQELDALSRRYSKVLGGLAMAYENVQLVSSRGWLFSTNPFIHVVVRAQFYVFAPEAGTVMEAVVKKKTKTHIGCLVHGMFNVSISKPIGSSVNGWCGTYAQEGDFVKLTITHVTFTTFVPHIKAEFDHESVQKLMMISTGENEDDGVIDGNTSATNRIVFDSDSGISSNECKPLIKSEKKRNKARCLDFNDEALEDDTTDVKTLKKVKGQKRKRSEDNFNGSYIDDTDGVNHKKKKQKRDSSMYGDTNKTLDMDVKQEKEGGTMNDIVGDNVESVAEFKDTNHKKSKKKRSMDGNMNKSLEMDDDKSIIKRERNDNEGFSSNSITEFRDTNHKKSKKKRSMDGNMNKSLEINDDEDMNKSSEMNEDKDMNEREKNDSEGFGLNFIRESRDSNHKKNKKKRSMDGNVNKSLEMDDNKDMNESTEFRDSNHKKNKKKRSMDGNVNKSLEMDDKDMNESTEFRDSNHKKRKKKSMDGNMNKILDMDVKLEKEREMRNDFEGNNIDSVAESRDNSHKKRKRKQSMDGSMNDSLDMDDIKHRKKRQKENNNNRENALIAEFREDGKKKRGMDENMTESLDPEVIKYERQGISKDSKGVIVSKVNESPKKSKKKKMLSNNNKETDSINHNSNDTVKENVNQFKSQKKTVMSEIASPRQAQVTIISPSIKSKDVDTSYQKKRKRSVLPQELKGSKITPPNSKKQHSRQLSQSATEISTMEMFAELPLPDFESDEY